MADSQRKTANLFDVSQLSLRNGYAVNDNGVEIESQYTGYTLNHISCEQETQCVLSNLVSSTNNGYYRVYFYDEDDNFISRTSSYVPTTMPFEMHITTPSNATSFAIQYAYGGVTNNWNDLMINSGSTPLPYEPYGWVHSLRKLGTSTDTLTTLPADLYADGNNATVGLVGNMQQSGTPTPQNPIQPQETGERTGNLWDGIIGIDNVILTETSLPTPNTAYALSEYIPVEPNKSYVYHFYHNIAENRSTYSICEYDSNKDAIRPLTLQWITENRDYNISFTTRANTAYIRINWKKAPDEDLMLVEGSTPLPYEPYGYKIPISSANTTTPVYLGEVESTRKIKKLVLDGTESNWQEWSGLNLFRLPDTSRDYRSQVDGAICDSLPLVARGDLTTNTFCWSAGTIGEFIININNYNLADLKTYLNNNPITIWYVLATPETAVVNEPLRKIGDYADTVSGITIPTITGKDTFDVLTSLKPSEVDLTYTGWHDASVKEKSVNLWNESYTGIMQNTITYLPLNVGDGNYTLSSTVTTEGQAAVLFLLSGNVSTGASTVNNGVWNGQSRTVTAVDGYVTIGYRKYTEANPENANTMLNTGSIALPYEPYWN